MFKLLVVLSATLCVVYAAVGIAQLPPKPEKFNQEGCYIKNLDEVIPYGTSKPSKTSCMEYRCGTKNIKLVSCGAVGADPPCTIKADKTKPYPECCPEIVCP